MRHQDYIDLFFDKDALQGAIGLFLSAVVPALDNVNGIIQVIAGLGGIWLLYFTIKHKQLQIRDLKRKQNLEDHEKTD